MMNPDPFADRHGPSGRWSGYYHHDAPSHAGRTFPIRATLWEAAGRVEGLMSDAVTDFAYVLRKVIDGAEAAGKVVAPIFLGMLERHPDTIMESTLPAESVLRGRFRGDVVRFTKTYSGSHSTRFRDAVAVLARSVRPKHRVHYSGVFDAMRGVIEGTWEIRQPGPFGRFLPRLGTGTFFLSREA